MATGTGISWVLFQVAWKLIRSGYCHRILYLTDLVFQQEQIKKIFRPLDQHMYVLSKTHPVHVSTHVHMATVSQLRTDEISQILLSLPVDFYDLIFLESRPNEKALLPLFEHFSMATRITIDTVKASTFPLLRTMSQFLPTPDAMSSKRSTQNRQTASSLLGWRT